MDVVDVYAVAKFYDNALRNCYIDNIYFSKTLWLFKLRCKSGVHLLKVEPGVRVHLSSVEPSEKSVDKLAAFMRKYLRNARITSIAQYGWERLIVVEASSSGGDYKLFVELLPRGFLVVADRDGKILYADRFEALRDREIKRGLPYKPPPGWSSFEEYFANLPEKLSAGKDLVRGLVKGWGLPGYIAEEVLYRAGLFEKRNSSVSELCESDKGALVEVYKSILSEVLGGRGYVVEQSGEPQLYTLYKPSLFIEHYGSSVREYGDFNEVLDYYFTVLEKKAAAEAERARLESVVKSLEKTIESQKKLAEEYLEKHRLYTAYAEILARNYPLVDSLLECVNRVRRERGWDSVVGVCEGVVRAEKDKGLIVISIENAKIPLDVRLDAWKNTLKYQALAGEYKSLYEKAVKHLEELVVKLEEARRAVQVAVEKALTGIKPKLWFERYHWIETSSGFLAVGGRDASQNESVVKKYLEPTDIFMHADVHGAPAVVLMTGKREVGEEDLRDAAVIAACYSRAWREGFGYVDVFWVRGDQVSKTPPTGEYLGKGAFMVYGKKNYLRVELKLAIGIQEVCDPVYGVYRRVIAGPEDLVKKRSLAYAVLVPGETQPSKLSEYLLEKFREILGEPNLGVTLSEILERIPGASRIVKYARGEALSITEC